MHSLREPLTLRMLRYCRVRYRQWLDEPDTNICVEQPSSVVFVTSEDDLATVAVHRLLWVRQEHALAVHKRLLPVSRGIFRCPGAASAKAAVAALGLPAGPVRAPLLDLSAAERATMADDFASAGLTAAHPV